MMEQSPNFLRRMAPEIRNMILEYALTSPLEKCPSLPGSRIKKTRVSKMRKVPGLLVALRAAPDLYGQALEVFYKVNRFILDLQSFPSFCMLRVENVKLIREIIIDLRAEDATEDSSREFLRLFTYNRSNLAVATGIRTLIVASDYADPKIYSLFDNCVAKWSKLESCEVCTKAGEAKTKHLETQMLEYLEEFFATKERTQSWKMMEASLDKVTIREWNSPRLENLKKRNQIKKI